MEKLKQKINYLIHKRNSLWATAMLAIGGTVNLILRVKEGLIVHLFILAGIIFSVLLIKGCIRHENYIEKLINHIKDEVEK